VIRRFSLGSVRESMRRGTRFSRSRRGQSLVEYLLAISVISIGLAVGFLELTESTKDSFKNASSHIQKPFP
jgi:hypothetical protein